MLTALTRRDVRGTKELLLLALGFAVLVAVTIFALYPASYVTGSHPFWQDPSGDLAQHSTGANYFLQSPWGFPLFHVPALGIPEGTSIVYTDSLPLMALVMKLVRSLTGEAQLYFSYWVFLSALLQAPAFCLALFAAGVRSTPVLVLGGLLALFAPAWWFAFSHVQLFGHFMILIGIALLFFAARSERPLRQIAWFAPLLAAAMLVSGYMFLMIGMLFGLSLLSALWRGRTTAVRALAAMVAAGALAAAILVAGGYLGTSVTPKNYGLFSLNLLGFVTPQMSGLVPGLDDYVLDATGGQSQGFAYLGLGVLLVAAVATVAGRRELAQGLRDDPTLLIGALAILLYGASYAVYAGPVLIAGLPHAAVKATFLGLFAGKIAPGQALAALNGLDLLRIAVLAALAAALPASLLILAWRQGRRQLVWFLLLLGGVFALALLVSPRRVLFGLTTLHASGRFAWLLVYLIMVLAVAGLARRLPGAPALAVLGLALVLQVADSGPVQERLRAEIRAGEGQAFSDAAAVEAALAGAARFILSPTFHCANIEIEDRPRRKAVTRTLLRLEFLGSKTAVPMNSVLNARLTTVAALGALPDCAAERERALNGGWGPGSVTYFLTAATPAEALVRLRSDGDRCRELDHGVLCSD